ncbi:Fungal-trans domain containing protein, partial [Pyrenophora tritici-repentis]
MPPKATPDASQKMYSADVVAAVLCSTGTTSLSNKNYEMMSALDGKKTASAFQHDFRAVIAKAKELKARVEEGEAFEPVAPASQRKGKKLASTPTTPKKRKPTSTSPDSDSNSNTNTPPPKKKTKTPTPKKPTTTTTNTTAKTTPTSKTSNDADEAPSPPLDDDEELQFATDEKMPFDVDTFIKEEMEWEHNF